MTNDFPIIFKEFIIDRLNTPNINGDILTEELFLDNLVFYKIYRAELGSPKFSQSDPLYLISDPVKCCFDITNIKLFDNCVVADLKLYGNMSKYISDFIIASSMTETNFLCRVTKDADRKINAIVTWDYVGPFDDTQ